jgi:hypothetical protein
MPGPVPKDSRLRQRRNKKTTAATLIVVKPVNGIPELPVRRRKWRPETLAWWKSVQESPMAQQDKYLDIDLHRLYMMADLTDEYWRLPAKEIGKKQGLANELRLQGQNFGFTPLDRSRLQWQMEKEKDAKNKGQKQENERYKLNKHQVDPRTVISAVN